jgi:hypothetical protein
MNPDVSLKKDENTLTNASESKNDPVTVEFLDGEGMNELDLEIEIGPETALFYQ